MANNDLWNGWSLDTTGSGIGTFTDGVFRGAGPSGSRGLTRRTIRVKGGDTVRFTVTGRVLNDKQGRIYCDLNNVANLLGEVVVIGHDDWRRYTLCVTVPSDQQDATVIIGAGTYAGIDGDSEFKNPSVDINGVPILPGMVHTGLRHLSATSMAAVVGGVDALTIKSNEIEVLKPFKITSDSGQSPAFFDQYSSDNTGSGIICRKARGTPTDPVAVASSDFLVALIGRGYGDTGFGSVNVGLLGFRATQAFTDTAQGCEFTLGVTGNGTTTRGEAIRVTQDRVICTGTPSSKDPISSAVDGISFGDNGYGRIKANSTNTDSLLIGRGDNGNVARFFFVTAPSSNTNVGSISITDSATAFNTTSDETMKDFTGDYSPEAAYAIIKADPTREFTWKETGRAAIGWGAQTSYGVSTDLASPGGWVDPKTGEPWEEGGIRFVHPETGEPAEGSDTFEIASDDEGEGLQVVSPEAIEAAYIPWGVDQSKRTPYLWAAVSGLIDRIEALEVELQALKE